MNKTLEAALRGYVIFKVNDEFFFRYNSALKRRKEFSEQRVNVCFKGFNPFRFIRDFFPHEKDRPNYPKGWRGFYESIYFKN